MALTSADDFSSTARGRHAEALAEAYLQRDGYRVVERNHRCAGGELDLIAWDGLVLCFIEVRARTDVLHGHPLETIGPVKIRRVVRAAADYISRLPPMWPQMRFDALGIVLRNPPEFTLVRGAFEAP